MRELRKERSRREQDVSKAEGGYPDLGLVENYIWELTVNEGDSLGSAENV